jgi:lipopolysaccharide/colanic/teichoic acid biosynthesis glycosyltransferase
VLFSGKGGAFFVQKRVGKSGVDFKLFKFRTMRLDSESSGQITIGGRDPRITKIGYFLRKFKLDELPQLLNIIGGSMSVVGPRPEVRKYVQMYTEEQLKVLSIKPGLTDYASIEYIDENEILGRAEDPNEAYINEVMPAKLALNQKYIDEQSFGTDLKIIFRTIGKVFS